jgi:hypothetical protein
MRALKLRGNKFGSRAWEYGGVKYASKLEAGHAATLDLLIKAGEVRSWQPQVKVDIFVNGIKVCFYKVDFQVLYEDGRTEWHELKGMDTPVGNLKIKLFRACYPDRVLKVIR